MLATVLSEIILPHCVSPGILTRNKKSPGLLLDKNAVSVGQNVQLSCYSNGTTWGSIVFHSRRMWWYVLPIQKLWHFFFYSSKNLNTKTPIMFFFVYVSGFFYQKQKRLEKQFQLESVTEWILCRKKKLLMCHASYSK